MTSYVNPKSQLFMGCHYYIEQRLCIFYEDKSCYCMNVRREKGYYKKDSITQKLTELEKHLTQKETPSIIYTNRSYINKYVEKKYQPMVEFEMIHNIDQNWKDIKEIVVYEERYER